MARSSVDMSRSSIPRQKSTITTNYDNQHMEQGQKIVSSVNMPRSSVDMARSSVDMSRSSVPRQKSTVTTNYDDQHMEQGQKIVSIDTNKEPIKNDQKFDFQKVKVDSNNVEVSS